MAADRDAVSHIVLAFAGKLDPHPCSSTYHFISRRALKCCASSMPCILQKYFSMHNKTEVLKY
jgi:hypothetical protein